MAKLADITFETRIIIKVLAGFLICLAALFMILRGGQFIIKTFFTPTPPPTMTFGNLPAIQFPKQSSLALEYRINTLDGTLSPFPTRMNVYKIMNNEPSLVTLQNARNAVRGGGFTMNETKINDSIYQWSDSQGRRIEYNILTNNFKIGSEYTGTESIGDLGARLSSKERVFETAADFLDKLSEDASDLDPQKTETIYLKVDNGRIVQAESQSDAQFMRVDLFQKDLDKYPIFYPAPKQSSMYFVFKSESGFPVISEASYMHFRPDTENSSDYYIKTVDQAFQDLKNGKAFIWLEDQKTKVVDITEVKLGYYVGEQNQNFFMPIAIFSGNGFIAYVQVIPDELIEE